MGAGPFDGRANGRLLVHDEVVEDDDIAGPERRHEYLLDVGEKRGIVDRAVEHRRRVQAIPPQRGDDRVRVPVTARRVIAEPQAARAPPVPAEQIGRDAGFIEEEVLARIAQRLASPATGAAPRRRQAGVARRRVPFFLTVKPKRLSVARACSGPPSSAAPPGVPPASHRDAP